MAKREYITKNEFWSGILILGILQIILFGLLSLRIIGLN